MMRWCLPTSGMFVSVLANHTFFVGSVFWVISPLLLWVTLYTSPDSTTTIDASTGTGVLVGNVLALIAGVHFVIGGPLYLYEWQCDRRVGDPPIYAFGVGGSPVYTSLERHSWLLYSLLLFLFGALADVMTSVLSIWSVASHLLVHALTLTRTRSCSLFLRGGVPCSYRLQRPQCGGVHSLVVGSSTVSVAQVVVALVLSLPSCLLPVHTGKTTHTLHLVSHAI
jgi:hypothetical protein